MIDVWDNEMRMSAVIRRFMAGLLVLGLLVPVEALAQAQGTTTPPAPPLPGTNVAPAAKSAAPEAQAVLQTLPPNAHMGQVVFMEQPVPGATVTATQGDKKVVTTTDPDGVYRLLNLAAGKWTIKIEMIGFAPITQDVTIPAEGPPPTLTAMLLPFDEIAKGIELVKAPPPAPTPAAIAGGSRPAQTNGSRTPAPGTGAQQGQGFQRAGVNQTAAPPPERAAAPPPPADAFGGATDGIVVNGSVNNGAASPFAQLANFGNNRRGGRSLYNYRAGMRMSNSAWDAKSWGVPSQPSYNNMFIDGAFGGPLRLPWVRNDPQIQMQYQRTANTDANTAAVLMPTAAQRAGDFFGAQDVFGNPIIVRDPLTGQPFAGNRIPTDRVSPQALALLAYYPQPNNSDDRRNFQTATLGIQHSDSLQTQISQPINNRNNLNGNLRLQKSRNESTSIFGFEDHTEGSSVDAQVLWNRRFGQLFTVRMRYQFSRNESTATPFFANRTNVSGIAGIVGNNQDPNNWGPPRLSFSTGIQGLSSGQFSRDLTTTNSPGVEAFWNRGRHSLTFGGSMRRISLDRQRQDNPRGMFQFTGYATGSDFGDFLLGLPRTSSLAFGTPEKQFRGYAFDGYLTDDFRLGPSFTVTGGVRWEYESPISDSLGRMVNLDVAPGFTAAVPVLADHPVGSLTGTDFGTSLVRPDRLGFQPRTAIAWRPVPGSSLVVRAGYGIYRNTNVYQSLANFMSEQPPISRTFNVETSAANPLTLANGFSVVPTTVANTFAIDPNFKVGYAQNWQASVQRDLPMSLTVLATYLGVKGHRLPQQILPNTYPVGGVNPCPTCPIGFVYLSSTGSSTRNSAQIQVRRRLRNGLTAQVQYTLAKANDDATAFNGAALSSGIAQDWRNLDAEWAPSSFDQRHNVNASFQYSTGAGVAGGALIDGIRGALLKGWTVTGNLIVGSGTPLTPLVALPVPGTAISNVVRARLTGAPVDADGYYANPAAFGIPEPGTWGNAGRNSLRGPSQFTFNAGLTRTFLLGGRTSLDWRVDGNNILNRVTFQSYSTTVGGQQFGLPSFANQMRKLTTNFTFRF